MLSTCPCAEFILRHHVKSSKDKKIRDFATVQHAKSDPSMARASWGTRGSDMDVQCGKALLSSSNERRLSIQ